MKQFLLIPAGILLAALSVGQASAQGSTAPVKKDLPKGWHLSDKEKDGFYGISLDKAYEFVKGKTSKTVLPIISPAARPVMASNAVLTAKNR